MGAIDESLKQVLGDRYITGNLEEVSKYFKEKVSSSELGVAFPKSHEEVQAIVKSASETGTPLFSNCDRYLPQDISSGSGVIVDLKDMKKIERLDVRNLLAHVQVGVTYAELQSEIKGKGLRMMTPAASISESVAQNLVNRGVLKSAAKYPEVQVTNMYVILADGRLHKSGSHDLSEELSDAWDGAALISTWYMGSCNTFGIITRATIALYPTWEKRNALVFDFDNLDGALRAMRDIPRREIGIEYIVMDKPYLKTVADVNGASIAKWSLIVGFDGFEKHVNWQEKMVRGYVEELGGKLNNSLSEVFAAKIDEPWLIKTPYHTGFCTLFSRVADFDESLSEGAGKGGCASEEIGRMFVAIDRGRTAYCVYGFTKDGPDTGKLVDGINNMLLEKGAYFDMPIGDLSGAAIGKIEGYGKQLKRVKGMMDPKGILNPGVVKI